MTSVIVHNRIGGRCPRYYRYLRDWCSCGRRGRDEDEHAAANVQQRPTHAVKGTMLVINTAAMALYASVLPLPQSFLPLACRTARVHSLNVAVEVVRRQCHEPQGCRIHHLPSTHGDGTHLLCVGILFFTLRGLYRWCCIGTVRVVERGCNLNFNTRRVGTERVYE